MKRIMILLLAFAMVCMCVGCGDPDKTPASAATRVSGADAPAEAPADEEPDGQEPVDEEPADDTTTSSEPNIQEAVIFNANDITVTAKSISYDGWMGPELSLLIENNSAQNITVQTRDASLNGLMVDPYMSVDVAAGKKANDVLTFPSSALEASGITTISEIEFVLHFFETESWDDIVDSDVIVLTTDAAGYVQEFDDSGVVAFEQDGFKIVAKKLSSTDSFWGAELYLYIENNSDTDVTVQVRNVSVDGFMLDPIFSSDIVHGKIAFDSISFMESDLTDNGITDIGSIELSFHIFNMDSWDTILDSDPIIISFE